MNVSRRDRIVEWAIVVLVIVLPCLLLLFGIIGFMARFYVKGG